MEKPLEVSLEKGREIVQACEEGQTFMVVAYNNRYDPAFLDCKTNASFRRIRRNQLGTDP